MAFRGGDDVRFLPLSGGSTLNNSTCGVEKQFFDRPCVTRDVLSVRMIRYTTTLRVLLWYITINPRYE